MEEFQLRWFTPRDDMTCGNGIQVLQFRQYLLDANGNFRIWTEWKDVQVVNENY